MRGLIENRRFGTRTSLSKRAKLPEASRMSAPMIEFESFEPCSRLTKKDDYFADIGPLRKPPKLRVWLGALFVAKGLREFRLSSLKRPSTEPRNLSNPGLVR